MSLDPLAEKYPGLNPYVYCVQNPINLIDPDGRDFITYLINLASMKGTSIFPQKGLSTKKFSGVMKKFMQTDYGRNFVHQFMGKGDKAFGYTKTQDGKYAKYNFLVFEIAEDISAGDRGAQMGMAEAFFGARVTKGKLEIYMKVDSRFSEGRLLENVLHELILHGHKVDEYIKKFEELGPEKFMEWYNQNPSGDVDHKAIRDHNKAHKGYEEYLKAREQLLQTYPQYRDEFEEKDRLYQTDSDYKKL